MCGRVLALGKWGDVLDPPGSLSQQTATGTGRGAESTVGASETVQPIAGTVEDRQGSGGENVARRAACHHRMRARRCGATNRFPCGPHADEFPTRGAVLEPGQELILLIPDVFT